MVQRYGKLLVLVMFVSPHLVLAEASVTPRVVLDMKSIGGARCLAFTPDGKFLACGSADGAIRFWDVATGRLHHALAGSAEGVSWIAFSPDGETLASCAYNGALALWTVKTGKVRAVLDDGNGPSGPSRVRFSPNGRLVAAGASGSIIRIWEVPSAKLRTVLRWPDIRVTDIAFVGGGEVLAALSDDNLIRFWSATTGRMTEFLNGYFQCMAFSADGKRVIWGTSWGSMSETDVARGKHVANFPTRHESQVNALAISQDGHQVASASTDGTVRVWDRLARKELATLPAQSWVGHPLTFAPDSRTLATINKYGDVYVWDVGKLTR